MHHKIENTSNFQYTNNNTIKEEITRSELKFESSKNNKYLNSPNKLKEKNEGNKNSYKFVTKENSIEGNII